MKIHQNAGMTPWERALYTVHMSLRHVLMKLRSVAFLFVCRAPTSDSFLGNLCSRYIFSLLETFLPWQTVGMLSLFFFSLLTPPTGFSQSVRQSIQIRTNFHSVKQTRSHTRTHALIRRARIIPEQFRKMWFHFDSRRQIEVAALTPSAWQSTVVNHANVGIWCRF